MVELSFINLVKENSFLKPDQGKDIQIKVSGHAGFDKKNNDIVCAAISAVIQTAIISITRVCGLKQKIKQKSGFLESIVKINDLNISQLNNLLIVLNSMLAGLDEIRKIHPDSLSITFENKQEVKHGT